MKLLICSVVLHLAFSTLLPAQIRNIDSSFTTKTEQVDLHLLKKSKHTLQLSDESMLFTFNQYLAYHYSLDDTKKKNLNSTDTLHLTLLRVGYEMRSEMVYYDKVLVDSTFNETGTLLYIDSITGSARHYNIFYEYGGYPALAEIIDLFAPIGQAFPNTLLSAEIVNRPELPNYSNMTLQQWETQSETWVNTWKSETWLSLKLVLTSDESQKENPEVWMLIHFTP